MQMTHKRNKWLQILVQDDFPENLLRSENADLKFSVSNEGEDVNNKPRSRENVAKHREGNAENRRQGNRGTEDWNSRGIMIVLHCGKPTFISLPVSPPIYTSNLAISSSVNSKSPLFRRKIECPWIYSSPLRFPGYFEAPLFRTFFSFPL